jgi:serine phosphatase RsbU (regulator of sigma subunit)
LDRITSSYTLPLKSGNAVFGAVAVQFLDNVRHFSREETEALDLLFSMASLILVNADLFEKQKAELAKEKILAGQVRAAGNAQRLMLPQDTETDHVSIRTLFEPYHPVSGDSFGLHWNRSRTSLYGYILDITGHGVVTALQTAAADALVRQLVASEPPFSSYFLQELNRRLAPVLNEDTFAGFLGFVFDFKTKTLSYGAGGINHFLAYTDGTGLIVQVPGCFLGMVENPDVSVASIKFHPGDTFYFLTDGLEERLPNRMVDILGDFDFSIDVLRRLAKADDRWDDCAAICFRIKQ